VFISWKRTEIKVMYSFASFFALHSWHYEGPRTQGQKLQKLLAEESGESDHLKGATGFVNTGLHLKAEM
jgi:hypothetical protein